MKTTPGAEPGRPRRHDRQEECLDRPRDPLPTRVDGLPPLAPGYDAALDAGLRDLGIELTADARVAIEHHVRLLIAWNTAINLTAIREPAEIAVRHVVDSLSAVGILRERAVEGILDLGSGGGFPGLPLAAALPLRRVALVESTRKKARFLETAAAAMGVAPRVTVFAARAEEMAADRSHREAWPAVTARAVGSLAELVEVAFPLLAPGGCLIAWKRGNVVAEMEVARRAIGLLGRGRIEGREVAAAGLDGHRLIIVTKLGRTPVGYPRAPAARRKHPW